MESCKDATIVALVVCDEDVSQNRSNGHRSEKSYSTS